MDAASELVVVIVLCGVVGIVDAVVLRAVVGGVTDVSASPNTLGVCFKAARECHKLSKNSKRVETLTLTFFHILPPSIFSWHCGNKMETMETSAPQSRYTCMHTSDISTSHLQIHRCPWLQGAHLELPKSKIPCTLAHNSHPTCKGGLWKVRSK